MIMAQIELQSAEASKTKRKLHSSVHIDMTPMVDLGFLLITFFIFTTSLTEKNTMPLNVTKESNDSTSIPASKSLTFLLAGQNKVFAYEGRWDEAFQHNKIEITNFN